MLTVNVITLSTGEQLINGSVDGQKYNINYTEEVFEKLNKYVAEIDEAQDVAEYYKAIDEAKNLVLTTMSSDGDLITQKNSDLILDSKTGHYYVKIDDELSITPVPTRLVNVILESVEKGIDSSPIVKAWIRFLRNPNFTQQKGELFAQYVTTTIIDHEMKAELIKEEGLSEQVAEMRAMYNDVAITKEGLIVTKKYARLLNEGYEINDKNEVVKVPLYGKTPDTVDKITGKVTKGEFTKPEYVEDMYFEPPMMGKGGDAFLCGNDAGHVIRVGQLHKLEKWSMVNTNDDQSCVKGLHVGGWQYVQGYKSLNAQLLECFVDPAEIGAIVDINYGDGAIRVKEYFVYGSTEGRNKGIYHSSKYAAMKDKEWDAYKKEAVKKSNERVEQLGK